MNPPQTSQSHMIPVTGFTVARRRFRILKLLIIPLAINLCISNTYKQAMTLELHPPSTSPTSMIKHLVQDEVAVSIPTISYYEPHTIILFQSHQSIFHLMIKCSVQRL